MRGQLENSLLVGERHGKKCDGFDYGNSPSSIPEGSLKGKCIIHTTSAGTQGIMNATNASEIITGSLVNAKAVAEYILEKQPEAVSLVCMGNGGVRPAPEDELCAEYIKSILEGAEINDFDKRVEELQNNGGQHFFDEKRQAVFPEEDFWMCTKCNQFPFVIQIGKDECGYVTNRIDMNRTC